MPHALANNGDVVAQSNYLLDLDMGSELNWRAVHLPESAWLEHIPFAFWIMKVLRPSTFVELGTHRAGSYAAFCQAVDRLNLHTRCYAVDTWRGDEHSGFYDESVFAEVVQLNERLYRHFSSLLRMTFAEAVSYFADGEVDLLHIDGLHTYQAVSDDFHTWLPKLSDQAVVLFHDINVRRDEFGVWRLWRELSAQYPHFEFAHGHGLGVLGVGPTRGTPIQALFNAANRQENLQIICDAFASRGASTHDAFALQQVQAGVTALAAEAALLRTERGEAERRLAEEARLLAQAQLRLTEEAELHGQALLRLAEEVRARGEAERCLAEEGQWRHEAERHVEQLDKRLLELAAQARETEDERDRLRREREAVISSTFWRLSGPARQLLDALPSGLRRHARSGARLFYWLLTPHRTRERIVFLHSRRVSPASTTSAEPTRALAHSPNLLMATCPTVIEACRCEGNGQGIIDLERWRREISLPDGCASIALNRPIGIFVHLFYEELAEEIADYLSRIDLPKRIYVSTGSEEKQRRILQKFERVGIAKDTEAAIVPDCGYDVAPLMVKFLDRLSQHDICLKIHSKKSAQAEPGVGDRWRKHLYDELIGDESRVRAIVSAMLADENLGILMAEHYYAIARLISIGPNYEVMRDILAKVDLGLGLDQKIEFPSGTMFWFRSGALVDLRRLGFDWPDFGTCLGLTNSTLAHGMERCLLFFCANAGKNWGFLPPFRPRGPKISREETIRLIRVSGVFDETYYRARYPDIRDPLVQPIEHWVDVGSREARVPSDPLYPNPIAFDLLECHLLGLPIDPGGEDCQNAISGSATSVEIHCEKAPAFESELALFVTHSPDARLKPHVHHYVKSLRRQGIAVVLIVNADDMSIDIDADILSCLNGLFIRQNEGYDFAAWAHVIQIHRELLNASILYWINDSLIGPIGQSEFTDLVNRIRDRDADVVGLTESTEKGWHLQSFFLAFKKSALLSCAFMKFIESTVCYKRKEDAIIHYELRLAGCLKANGLVCAPIFRARDALNPTIHHWKELVESGFPFVKSMVVYNAVPGLDTSDCLGFLSSRGFKVAESSIQGRGGSLAE